MLLVLKLPPKLPAPNNIKSSSILKCLNVVKEAEKAESLKCIKVLKEVFQCHFWLQSCIVPTKTALLQNSLNCVKLPPTSQNPNCSVASSPLMPSSANLDLNIQLCSLWKALVRLRDLVQRNQPWTICVDKDVNGIVMVKRLEVKKGKAKLATF